jgi:superfamily II DNA/RNA helicase
VSVTDLPDPPPSFASLGVPAALAAALSEQGIEAPTQVQGAMIPDALSGRDVLARARTGSGKTLAFGVPVLARLAGGKSRIHRPRALVVVPTRELAAQVHEALAGLAAVQRVRLTTVHGGARYDKQVSRLRQGADLVVATPGRLRDLIDKRVLRTDDVQVTVLDEADQLCDLGFYPVVDELLGLVPPDGQRLLLSATLDGEVDRLVARHLRDPVRHEVDDGSAALTSAEHHLLVVRRLRDKPAAVLALVRANPRAIVFTRTREGAEELRRSLEAGGVGAVDLHGNLPQHLRQRNLQAFASGRAQVVVATDLASRGLHVDEVSLVVHYDPPSEPKAYLHRSGRTARAGESGAVVTLVTPRQLERVVRTQGKAGVVAFRHELGR